MSSIFKNFFLLSILLLTFDDNNENSNDNNNNNNNYNNNNALRIYESWLVEHNKQYNAIGEKERRFLIFKDNLMFIDEHNNNNNNDNNNNDDESRKYYKLGLNKFADLTVDEFRSLCFSRASVIRKGQNDKTAVKQPVRVATEDGAREFQFHKSGVFKGKCGIATQPTYLSQPSLADPSQESRVACDSFNSCPSGNTCCCVYTYGPYCLSWGCCPKESAVCCDDGSRCCPSDYPICNTRAGTCSKKKNSPLSVKALERTPAIILHTELSLAKSM